MKLSSIDIQEIQSRVAPLVGLRAWGVSLGYGSFITFEFGKRKSGQEYNGIQRGEWHLWIYCAVWRLELGSEMIIGSEDPRPLISDSINRLEGAILRSVTISKPTLDTVFMFEPSNKLSVFPISYHDESEHWMLYTPDGNCLTIGPGVEWSYQSASSKK